MFNVKINVIWLYVYFILFDHNMIISNVTSAPSTRKQHMGLIKLNNNAARTEHVLT